MKLITRSVRRQFVMIFRRQLCLIIEGAFKTAVRIAIFHNYDVNQLNPNVQIIRIHTKFAKEGEKSKYEPL